MVIIWTMSICSQLAEMKEVFCRGLALLFVVVIPEYRGIIRFVACNCNLTALKTGSVGFDKRNE